MGLKGKFLRLKWNKGVMFRSNVDIFELFFKLVP